MDSPERWRRIQEVFQAALEMPGERRAAFLDAACAGDVSLRQEVESLLRSSEEAGNFLEPEASRASEAPRAAPSVDPWLSKQVGSYKIVEKIAFGGMGVVYRAEDVRLGRGAALKFLSVQLQRDPLARERFEREARAASALNHPNICTIYGVGEFEGHPYLAMELLKGQTLGKWIQRGPLPTERMLDLAIPIASALEAAHSEGIIHRDLKPANIFVTEKEQVKILDFGLAKQTGTGIVSSADTETLHAPESEPVTSPGTLVGTVSYMSPEQVRGERLDARSDLFSFGAVLYEMAAGHPAFPGRMPVLIIDAVLNRPPAALREANRQIPVKLEEIIAKSLEKSRDRRYQSATELLHELRELKEEIRAGPVTEAPFLPRRRRAMWPVLSVLLLLAIAAGGSYWWKFHGAPPLPNPEANRALPSLTRPSVAVLGFQNLAGRPEHAWLSTAFSEMLATELAAGGRLRVVPGEIAARAHKELNLGESPSYSQETLQRIRKNLGVDYIVTGSYFDSGKDAGSQVRLDIRLQNTRSGELLTLLPQTGTESKLIELLSHSGADLRAHLGIGEVGGSDVTRVAATIPTHPAAARLYSEGLAKLRELDPAGARDLLKKASAIEPDHPLVHAALAEAWSQLGYDEKSRTEGRLAASLAGQLPHSDQLWVEGRFRESTKEWGKAIDVYRTLLGFYPDNIEYGLRLVAVETNGGRQKDALQTIANLRKLPPPANSDPRIDLAEAEAAEISADFQRERSLAARALEESRNRGERQLSAKALYAAAWAALNLGDMAGAAQSAEEARSIYVAAGDRNGEANMLRTLGTVRLMQGDLSGAMAFYQNALRLARQVGNGYSEAAALNQMASTLERQAKRAAALENYQKALAIVREIGNKPAEATTVNNIANILWARGDLNGARQMYDQAVTVAQQLGDRSREAGSSVNIAHILEQEGDLKEARRKIENAITLARSIGEQSILGEAANSYGDICLAQGDFTEADRRFREALSYRQKSGEQLGLAETQMSIAELRMAEQKPVEAEKLLRSAFAEFKKESFQDSEIAAAGLLAFSLRQQGKIAEAHNALDQVQGLAAKAENPYIRANFLIDAARIALASRRPAEAKATLDSVMQTANKFGFVNTQLKARLALAEVELHGGDSRAAERLAALERNAKARGFGAIAQQAAALRTK